LRNGAAVDLGNVQVMQRREIGVEMALDVSER
jgi:hypothetical protein